MKLIKILIFLILVYIFLIKIFFEIRKLINFCELEWDDNCLNFHKNKRSVSTASLAQVRKPIYNSSVEKWKSYGDELSDLIKKLS